MYKLRPCTTILSKSFVFGLIIQALIPNASFALSEEEEFQLALQASLVSKEKEDMRNAKRASIEDYELHQAIKNSLVTKEREDYNRAVLASVFEYSRQTAREEEERRNLAADKVRILAEAKRIADENARLEAERIAEQQRVAEAKRIADENARLEADRIVAEQRAAEAKRIADENAKPKVQILSFEDQIKLKAEQVKFDEEKINQSEQKSLSHLEKELNARRKFLEEEDDYLETNLKNSEKQIDKSVLKRTPSEEELAKLMRWFPDHNRSIDMLIEKAEEVILEVNPPASKRGRFVYDVKRTLAKFKDLVKHEMELALEAEREVERKALEKASRLKDAADKFKSKLKNGFGKVKGGIYDSLQDVQKLLKKVDVKSKASDTSAEIDKFLERKKIEVLEEEDDQDWDD
ncbi:MAG: hypothetical protein Q8S31_06330 [Alphaproteobacteria bacterium]|nr:hypothetical protein [Alphaproteobacteria bacterium]